MFISAKQARRVSARTETGTVDPALTQRDELFCDHFQDYSISFLANLWIKMK